MRIAIYLILCLFTFNSAASVAASCCWNMKPASDSPLAVVDTAPNTETMDSRMPCHDMNNIMTASSGDMTDQPEPNTLQNCDCNTCFDSNTIANSHSKHLPFHTLSAINTVNTLPEDQNTTIYHPPRT